MEVVSDCTTMLNTDNTYLPAYMGRGSAYVKLANYAAAEADFSHAITMAKLPSERVKTQLQICNIFIAFVTLYK